MRRLLSALVLLSAFSLPAHSATIALNDWWLQTDTLGGLRQNEQAPTMFFAVAQDNVWSKGDVYEAPTGYHWASSSEASALISGLQVGTHVYYNKGGWSGYTWEGKSRHYFRFSDSHLNNSYKHAGNYDAYQVQYSTNINNFAGLVLIQDAAPAPAPAGLGLMGLAALMLLRRRNR